jgi:hypothetical protein
MSEWEGALDAMEEWVRRTTDAARDGKDAPAAPVLPREPLPEELSLRARALLAALQEAEAGVARARARMQREHAYGAA